jgi:hypothetical protein
MWVKFCFALSRSFNRDTYAHGASGGEWIERRNFDSFNNTFRHITLGNLADMELVSPADVLVGQLGSHTSRNLFYAMTGRAGNIPPFISVDGSSACCEVDQGCSPETTNRKNAFVDCLRKVSVV